MRRCSVPGCDRVHLARGWCSLHYQRWLRHGTTDDPRRRRQCTVPGCDQPRHGRGLCGKHWMRERQHGSPTAPLRLHRFTPREDEQLLALPTVGRSARVAPGRMQDLALTLGVNPESCCNRRRLLLRRADGTGE